MVKFQLLTKIVRQKNLFRKAFRTFQGQPSFRTNVWSPKQVVTWCFLMQNVYSTMYSQAVTHPSTNMAQCCLTSVIGRELVFSTWYGRCQECEGMHTLYDTKIYLQWPFFV